MTKPDLKLTVEWSTETDEDGIELETSLTTLWRGKKVLDHDHDQFLKDTDGTLDDIKAAYLAGAEAVFLMMKGKYHD